MKIKVILAAAALAASATMGHAVTFLSGADSGGTFDLLADNYQFQETFSAADSSPFMFTFENSSATNAVVTISAATILQFDAAFFTDGASVKWSDNGTVVETAEAISGGGQISFILGAGMSDTLTLSFGEVVTDNGLRPDIDFFVNATPIPVPAGILLLGTALAGLGVMRRKAKKTT